MSPIHAQKTQRGFNSRVALLDGSEAQCGFLVCYMPLADLRLFYKQP